MTTTTRRRWAQILAFTLLPAVFALLLVDINQTGERSSAEQKAKAHGLSCMALSDPTVGAYTLTEELKLLAQADPQAAAYFHTAGVTVTPLDGATSTRCFGKKNSNNPVGTKAIFLNTDRLKTPGSRAVALSHELVHVEHGDPTTVMSRHSRLRHLWMTEEGEAHLHGLQTARRLQTPLMYPAWQEYITWIYLLPISYAVFLLTAVLFIREIRRERLHKHHQAKVSTAHVL